MTFFLTRCTGLRPRHEMLQSVNWCSLWIFCGASVCPKLAGSIIISLWLCRYHGPRFAARGSSRRQMVRACLEAGRCMLMNFNIWLPGECGWFLQTTWNVDVNSAPTIHVCLASIKLWFYSRCLNVAKSHCYKERGGSCCWETLGMDPTSTSSLDMFASMHSEVIEIFKR